VTLRAVHAPATIRLDGRRICQRSLAAGVAGLRPARCVCVADAGRRFAVRKKMPRFEAKQFDETPPALRRVEPPREPSTEVGPAQDNWPERSARSPGE